ncbi:alpha/beta fold hydrolase [Natronococcus pandeyae]|nr:alpha/beta hydrolase [Natronococcus pandeyae]
MPEATPPDEEAEMETVTSADGTEIAYKRTGSGPPLVLVHGSGVSDHRRWKIGDVLHHLAEHATVYALDRRGRGESGDGDRYSMDREVKDVVAVVESIGEPVTLLGHSYGANLALEASLVVDSLSGLILYEPGIPVDEHEMGDPEAIARMNKLLADGRNEAALEVFLRDIGGLTPDEIDAFRADPSWDDRVAGTHTLPREELACSEHELHPERLTEMTAPTLLLSGGESPRKYKDAVNAIDEALPDSRVVTFEGEQHVAMNTRPELFVDEVVSFIRGVN